ncbi:hypothetical protein QQ045_009337 [Rhodiola kirilowii]
MLLLKGSNVEKLYRSLRPWDVVKNLSRESTGKHRTGASANLQAPEEMRLVDVAVGLEKDMDINFEIVQAMPPSFGSPCAWPNEKSDMKNRNHI